jgi:hypothetical protein
MYVAAAAALACDYTVRDIGFVEFSPPKLRMVLLFQDRVGDARLRELQGALSQQILEGECHSWNLHFQAGALANLAEPTEEQRRWALDSPRDWSLWMVRDDGATRLLEEGSLPESMLKWSTLLSQHLERPLLLEYRQRALESFAQSVLFEGSDAAANKRAEEAIVGASTALNRAASLLPRPIAGKVQNLRVRFAERADYATLLWLCYIDDTANELPFVCTLYGRGRLAGPVLTGDPIPVESLLSQLVLVGQSCECGTERNWVQYPRLPLDWPEPIESDMAHYLGFDPGNAVVIEEVKRIIQRGPQNLQGNARDDVSAVVSATLGLDASGEGRFQAQVIQGDGWDFDPPAAVPPLVPLAPVLMSIPPGRQSDSATAVAEDALPQRSALAVAVNASGSALEQAVDSTVVRAGGQGHQAYSIAAGALALLVITWLSWHRYRLKHSAA